MDLAAPAYGESMTDAWTWTYLDAEGAPMTGGHLTTSTFPTQADAEVWFSESWEQLAEAGVDAVVLERDGAPVYGPMSLQGPA